MDIHWQGFAGRAVDLCTRNVDMTPETEDLFTDLVFKAGDDRHCDDHNRQAERNRNYSNSDDQPGKGLAFGKSNPGGYESFEVHGAKIREKIE